jgi:hypothetical protein
MSEFHDLPDSMSELHDLRDSMSELHDLTDFTCIYGTYKTTKWQVNSVDKVKLIRNK